MAALSPKLSLLLLLLLSLLAGPPPAASADELKTFSAIYPNFNDSVYYRSIFAVEDPATINQDALQITLDSAGDVDLTNQSGRIFLNKRFKLWRGSGGRNITGADRVASFNTSFLINIYRMNNATPGEGLAFVVAPDLKIPPNSHGQFLGLTNSTTDGTAANQILAVELDTCQQPDIGDPDANHVGLDINSARSDNVTSLTSHQMELAPGGGQANFFNIWVQYDGIKKVIEVYIAKQQDKTGTTPPKPAEPVLRKADLDLRSVVNQFSYFGFSASTGDFKELNCVLRWNLTVEHYGPSNNAMKIGLGVGAPMVALLAGAGAGLVYYLRKRRAAARSNSSILGALKSLPGMPREFGFKDLKRATGNFDERNKLGQGGFGVVYRGVIQSENLEVAVKWFSRESIKGEDDFLAELTIINRLRHKHLVRLLGWCHKNGKLLLVYEYMPNGSLDKHLFGDADDNQLSWNLRYKILSGVASALHYLHNEYDQKVVHRDLKASNIMLDSNFNARLGDFGLARALDNEKTSYAEAEGVLGTMGYIAPECFHTGKATQQSDVYAFGAVLLEVVCGLRPGTKIGGFQLLVDWVWCLHREGRLLEAVDERLGQDYVAEEAERVLLLGLACSHPRANERPRTQAIVQIISGSVAAPSVPPFKPPFVWPSMPVGLEDDTETDASQATITTDTRSFAIATSQYGSGWSPQTLSQKSYTAFNSDKFNFTPYNSDNYNKV